MGKGDKKSRRGKIILGTYGVRRQRKKAFQAAPEKVASEKVIKEKKPAKEVHAPKAEAASPKVDKPKKEVRHKKESEAPEKEPRPKKETKS